MAALKSIFYLHLILLSGVSLFAAEYAQEDTVQARFSEHKEEVKDSPLILQFPELKKFLYIPPKASVYIGLGIAPISLMNSKLFFSFNLFQAHYLTENWDWEILSASLGMTRSDKDFANSRHFTLRTSPKYVFMNLFDTGKVSIGPVVGIEYVEFPEIEVRKCRNNRCTPDYENLTTSGAIYGVSLSQTFLMKKDRRFKITEMYYKQNYDVTSSESGWDYDPLNSTIFSNSSNKDEIVADSVFLIEFSFLF